MRRKLQRAVFTNEKTVISIRGLVNSKGGKILHNHIDLDVNRGEVLAIVGSSGSGKTILMHSIIGLNKITSGEIRVLGQDIGKISHDCLRALQKHWGVLFQGGALFGSLTVRENIQIPLREYTDMSQQLMDEVTAMKVALVGLDADVSAKYPAQLSGGMKKRAGLARALALDPDILFLDEPTAGLDPLSASHIDDLVRRLQKGLNLTVVMITHDMDSLRETADRVAVLVDKELKIGTLGTLVDDPHPWIREYFAGRRGHIAFSELHS